MSRGEVDRAGIQLYTSAENGIVSTQIVTIISLQMAVFVFDVIDKRSNLKQYFSVAEVLHIV